MSIDRRKIVSACLALLAVTTVAPSLVTTFQETWKNRFYPFTFDRKVSVPNSVSSLATGQTYPPYQGIQTYQLPGLSAIIVDTDQIGVPKDILLSVKFESDQVINGENVTFLIEPNIQNKNIYGVVLFVFLVDPYGIVRAAFPDGKIPFLYPASYPNLDKDVLASMESGRLAFTYQIPQTSLSIGKWTVFVLGAPSYSNTALDTWEAAPFTVIAPPAMSNWLVSLAKDALSTFGAFLLVYGLVYANYGYIAPSFGLLRRNLPFLIGLTLIIIFLILKYFLA